MPDRLLCYTQGMSTIKIIIGFIVIIFVIAVIWRQRTPELYYPTSGETVIFFGDSLVEGIGATTGNDMVSLLSQSLGIEIINAGVSGDTTQMALTRLYDDVLIHDPRIVLIVLGGNDALRRIPQEQTKENLISIIAQIQETGAAVVLIGVKGSLLGDAYEDMFDEIASELPVNYIDNILKGIFLDSRLKADSIHPNDAGYALMAERIEPLLQKLLSQ